MEENVSFKKVFLITMIISLSLSALIGIILFLIGDFGEIERKIFLTTLTIGGFSLTALCSSALYDKHKYVVFSSLGMIIAVLGFLITTVAIWEILNFGNIKIIIILVILSVSIAHSSLLLLIKSEKTIVNISLVLTLLFISVVAIILIILVLSGFDFDFEFYYRFLGVFAILDVLGTIVTPIILKVTSMNN